MPTMYRVPPELWRIAYRLKMADMTADDKTTALFDREVVSHFEDEDEALQLLHDIEAEDGRVLSVHKLELVGDHHPGARRWVELDYSPPQQFGTLKPTSGGAAGEA